MMGTVRLPGEPVGGRRLGTRPRDEADSMPCAFFAQPWSPPLGARATAGAAASA